MMTDGGAPATEAYPPPRRQYGRWTHTKGSSSSSGSSSRLGKGYEEHMLAETCGARLETADGNTTCPVWYGTITRIRKAVLVKIIFRSNFDPG